MLQPQLTHSLHVVDIFNLSCTMFYLSGLFLLLVDPSMIYGQMTQDNRTAFEERPNVTYEDNDSEDFQTQNFFSHCHEKMLKDYGRNCSQNFSEIMSELGEENWCNMEMVIRHYNSLTVCMESGSIESGCFYPNHVVEQLFVRIHRQYFSLCSNEEDLLDAPAGVVLVATLLPILLIPFIVYIVVWKSSLRD
uniref:Si:ch73-334d15.2 n=1 Tax=Cyprinus carpio TaxID=7962 RepID=A0A8C1J4J5_CYPCA